MAHASSSNAAADVDEEVNVVVVGAGVSGLVAAWKLHDQGLTVSVLEARFAHRRAVLFHPRRRRPRRVVDVAAARVARRDAREAAGTEVDGAAARGRRALAPRRSASTAAASASRRAARARFEWRAGCRRIAHSARGAAPGANDPARRGGDGDRFRAPISEGDGAAGRERVHETRRVRVTALDDHRGRTITMHAQHVVIATPPRIAARIALGPAAAAEKIEKDDRHSGVGGGLV